MLVHSIPFRISTARRTGAEAGIRLNKRRAWYAEDAGSDSQQPDQQQDGGTDGRYNPKDLSEAMKIIEALNKRVGERDEVIKTLKPQVGTLQQQMESLLAAQRKKLEQDGNHEQLARDYLAQLEILKPQADLAKQYEAKIREGNERRIAAIPEQLRSQIPIKYSPVDLSEWLDTNAPQLTKPPAPNFEAGAGGGRGRGESFTELTEQEKAFAQAAGMTFERYAEMKKQKGQPLEMKKGGKQENK